MKYSAFIFDFDYTLADATKGIVECVNYALSKMHCTGAAEDRIKKTVGSTLEDTYTTLTGDSSASNKEQFRLIFKEKADIIMAKSTVLFPDTAEVLRSLRSKGCRTGIVTTKYRYRIEEVLKMNNASDLIDVIIGFEDVKEAKPSPEGLLAAISQLGCDSQAVLYIGDSIIDSKTAMHAGIDFAAVTTGSTAAEEFQSFPNVFIADGLKKLL